jgi:hypothetical protein
VQCSADSDDSFVVSDHISDAPSLEQEVHDICSSLRNRRKFISNLRCMKCQRMMQIIVKFVASLEEAILAP